MPEDIAYKPLHPYSKEVAAGIAAVPAPPKGIGFEYKSIMMDLVSSGSGMTGISGNYKVPSNKILYVTHVQISLYLDGWAAGLQSKGYGRITTNDVINYIAILYIRGGRSGNIMEDASETMTFSCPLPLRFTSGTTITFTISKSSLDVNSVMFGNFILHGYLVRK